MFAFWWNHKKPVKFLKKNSCTLIKNSCTRRHISLLQINAKNIRLINMRGEWLFFRQKWHISTIGIARKKNNFFGMKQSNGLFFWQNTLNYIGKWVGGKSAMCPSFSDFSDIDCELMRSSNLREKIDLNSCMRWHNMGFVWVDVGFKCFNFSCKMKYSPAKYKTDFVCLFIRKQSTNFLCDKFEWHQLNCWLTIWIVIVITFRFAIVL